MEAVVHERKRIGRLIARARTAKGLSQQEVGLMMAQPRSRSGVSALERGVSPIDVGELKHLGMVLGVEFYPRTPEQPAMRAEEV